MEAHFIVLLKTGKAKKFRLADDEYVIIGRSEKQCQVPIDDDLCSSTHCKISFSKNNVMVEDLDSKNGVYLNSVRILKQNVYINDKIICGKTNIYLNPKRMEADIVKVLSYEGKHGRGVGNLTLEVDGLVLARTDEILLKDGSTKKNRDKKVTRKKMTEKKIQDATKPVSSSKVKLFSYLAGVIDIFLSLVFFGGLITTILLTNPEMEQMSREIHFVKFLLNENMLIYSGGSLFCSVLFYSINKKLSAGSIGQRIFSLKKG